MAETIRESRGMPDPSLLTTQQLFREIAQVKELLDTRIECMNDVVQEIKHGLEKQPVERQADIGALQRLQDVKFEGIKTQFIERDTRTEQTSRDSKVAVDAALQAAKEAVAEQNRSSALAIAKSETATMKQIDQLGLLIQNSAQAVDGKINDIKERLTRIESEKDGSKETEVTHQSSTSLIMAIVGSFVGVAGLIIAIVAIFMRH